ncbi:MAG: ACP S-malonyltransferase [Symploca sp. SIO2E6]|nr:ACP S-malonyltransferase [Symploca sp. SIO2E6]
MTKTVWVFPGQGSQAVGMGTKLIDLPDAQTRFEQAEEILGWSVLDICHHEDKLSRTLYTQPCLYVIESILADLLLKQGYTPNLVAGHSLGEYVALYTARVFDFEAGLRLVKRRAELMDSASDGMMAALIGFDRQELETQIQQTPNVVLANDNSPAQVVISGTPEAVQEVLSQIKVKRATPLKVSGAFHSPLMAPAATEFQADLASAPFADAQVPVLSNVEPVPAVAASVLKDRLQRQMTGKVRWQEICRQMPVEGIERVVEIGPGKVLTGLVKRICGDLLLENVSSPEQVKTLFQEAREQGAGNRE